MDCMSRGLCVLGSVVVLVVAVAGGLGGTSSTAVASPNVWVPVGPNAEAAPIVQSDADPELGLLLPLEEPAPWVTHDAGQTWTQLPKITGLTAGMVPVAAIIDDRDALRWTVGLAGLGKTEIAVTRDAGRTWEVQSRFAGMLRDLEPIGDGGYVAAVMPSGDFVADLHVSSQRDVAPVRVPLSLPRVSSIAVSGGSVVLAADGVWIVDDVAAATPRDPRKVLDGKTLYPIAAEDDLIAVALTDSVQVSTDHGVTWAVWFPDATQTTAASLQIIDGAVVFDPARNTPSRLVTHDGETFETVPVPHNDGGPVSVAFWPRDTVTVAIVGAGVYRSTDRGVSYIRTGVQGSSVYALATVGSRLLAGTTYGMKEASIGVPSSEWGAGGEGLQGVRVEKLAVGSDGTLWRLHSSLFPDVQLSKSVDDGRTWTLVKQASGSRAGALMVHPADPDRIVMTTIEGKTNESPGLVLESADGGASWNERRNAIAVVSVAGDPRDPKRQWYGTTQDLYQSLDGGQTVEPVASTSALALLVDGGELLVGGSRGVSIGLLGGRGLTALTSSDAPAGVSVTSFIRVGHRLFAGTEERVGAAPTVMVSEDDGASFAGFGTGLNGRSVVSMTATPSGDALFAGSPFGGVSRILLDPSVAPVAKPVNGSVHAGQSVVLDVIRAVTTGTSPIPAESVRVIAGGAPSTANELPGRGAFRVTDGEIVFTASPTYTGEVEAQYRVTTKGGEIVESSLHVTVQPRSDGGAPDGGWDDPSGTGATVPTGGADIDTLAYTGWDLSRPLGIAVALLILGSALACWRRVRPDER